VIAIPVHQHKAIVERLKRWAGRLKVGVYALYLAYRDPRLPLYARIFAACVVGYAFSPIDLIPAPVLAECREKPAEPRTIKSRRTGWRPPSSWCSGSLWRRWRSSS
jgi:hypothetical protein